MLTRMAVITFATATIAQLPPNADFSSTDVSHILTWKNAHVSSIVVDHDATVGSKSPGSVHATVTGITHAETGIYFELPSSAVGGKTLEFRGKARMRDIPGEVAGLNAVPIVYWYAGQHSVTQQWQHMSVYEAPNDEWVAPKFEVKKLVEDGTKFTTMRIAFYLFRAPSTESNWEFWLDDIELIADGVNITGQSTLVAPAARYESLSIAQQARPHYIDILGRNANVQVRNAPSSQVFIYNSQHNGKSALINGLSGSNSK
jgi:hypothetical protein